MPKREVITCKEMIMSSGLLNIVTLCITLVLIMATLPSACQDDNAKVIEGDLYFKLVDVRYFEMPDSVLEFISNKLLLQDQVDTEDRPQLDYVQFLKENNLLHKPFVKLRLDNGDVVIVFMEREDYRNFDAYNLRDLQESNQKVRVRLRVSTLDYKTASILIVDDVISVATIPGTTYWEK